MLGFNKILFAKTIAESDLAPWLEYVNSPTEKGFKM
jgi:hypothetical protein